MKRKLPVGAMAFILFFGLAVFAAEPETDFREAMWGMSPEQIKAVETGKLTMENLGEGILAFEGKILKEPCEISYYFSENKLYQGEYKLTNDYNDIRDLEPILKWLDKTYHSSIGASLADSNRAPYPGAMEPLMKNLGVSGFNVRSVSVKNVTPWKAYQSDIFFTATFEKDPVKSDVTIVYKFREAEPESETINE